jgi:hypothetical protein
MAATATAESAVFMNESSHRAFAGDSDGNRAPRQYNEMDMNHQANLYSIVKAAFIFALPCRFAEA